MTPKEQITDNEKFFSDQRHLEWLKNKYTFECISKLEALRADILKQAEDNAVGLIADSASYRNKLIQAKTIRNILDYVRTNTYPPVS